ncbi:MAG: N-acetylmuramate alpha-1-phosphate uridylyltransferase MurU [Pseudomonadota bacterium]
MANNYASAETTVVLLAAGHGKRMLPLTKSTPKPLLKVGDEALIEHHLHRLRSMGFRDVVINLAYLGEQIRQHLDNGAKYGLNIRYSDESATGALETAGGLQHALPLISSDPFLVVNADIWTDYPFTQLLGHLDRPARLVMGPNPSHNPDGDFSYDPDSGMLFVANTSKQSHTFCGIALYHKSLFVSQDSGVRPLAPMFRELIQQEQLEAVVYEGEWQDIGTPERLASLNQRYKAV